MIHHTGTNRRKNVQWYQRTHDGRPNKRKSFKEGIYIDQISSKTVRMRS